MMAVHATKATLRREVKAALAALAAEERGRQQLELTRRVTSHPRFLAARRIGIYLSLPDEPDTAAILESALLHGAACFVPRYAHGAAASQAGSSESPESPQAAASAPPDMELLRVASMEDVLSLPLTPWKIAQPAMDDYSREDAIQSGGLDLLIVPGLAFSRDGRRLGRGKGFYDRFLRRLRSDSQRSVPTAAPCPYALAIAFSVQICEHLPTNQDDELIDEVLTA